MPKLTRVAPEVPALNLDESLRYYSARLGFEIEMTMPETDYAIVQRDGVALHLFQDNARSHSPVAFHIFTNDLEELYRELQGRGVPMKQPIVCQPWGNRDFRILDPAGNEIKFTEPLPEGADVLP